MLFEIQIAGLASALAVCLWFGLAKEWLAQLGRMVLSNLPALSRPLLRAATGLLCCCWRWGPSFDFCRTGNIQGLKRN